MFKAIKDFFIRSEPVEEPKSLWEQYLEAIKRCDKLTFISLIDQYPKVLEESRSQWNGDSLLHIAADRGVTSICKLIIDKFPESINYVNKYGTTPLHTASLYGHIRICKLIIDKAPQSINAVNLYDSTVLHSAVHYAQTETCRFLIPLMSIERITATDDEYMTALDIAESRNHWETARVIAEMIEKRLNE